jgi:hypothetical protein
LQISPVNKITKVDLLLRYKGWQKHKNPKKKEPDLGVKQIFEREKEAYLIR